MLPEVIYNESYAEIERNPYNRTLVVRYYHASPLGPLLLRDQDGEIVEDVLVEDQAAWGRIVLAEQTLRRMDIHYNV